MLALAPRSLVFEARGDALYLSSSEPLGALATSLGARFDETAARFPDRVFLIERQQQPDGALRELRYGEVQRRVAALTSLLLRRAPAPVLALSGNSVAHALLMLAAFRAGVPFVPVSPAYSLLTKDFAKLRRIVDKVSPGLVFVEDRAPFAGAVAVVDAVVGSAVDVLDAAAVFGAGEADSVAAAEVAADSVAKILFTSGSTGFPKGVPNTHRMLCANQQMIAQLWPFLADEPPVLVDWLPWSHTFGGNHNFNLALFHGGTFFVDNGKPAPALLPLTLANLRAVSPTIYLNVPAGYAGLIPHLENDVALARAFFARLRVLFYAAAALPDEGFQRLRRLAAQHAPHEVFLTTSWGATETAPMATSAHFPLERAGNIGLPAPGVTLKLVKNGSKLEARVKGPSVMSGYLDEPALTAAAFDDEGFYRIGDAVRFADVDDPSQGLVFDGRIAEDFKLTTGTWVSVSAVRVGFLSVATPVLADLVVAGENRDGLIALAWLNAAGCQSLVDNGADAFTAPAVHARLREALRAWNALHTESSMQLRRLVLLREPASLDASEVTDKGYINQRATLARRADVVDAAFAAADDLIVC